MINCDFHGCGCVPVVECRCRRCDREPDEESRDHSCAQHCDEVAVQHKRRTDRDAVWNPYLRPTTDTTAPYVVQHGHSVAMVQLIPSVTRRREEKVPADPTDPLVEYANEIRSAEKAMVSSARPSNDTEECIAALARALRDERAKVATAAETLRAITALVRPL